MKHPFLLCKLTSRGSERKLVSHLEILPGILELFAVKIENEVNIASGEEFILKN